MLDCLHACLNECVFIDASFVHKPMFMFVYFHNKNKHVQFDEKRTRYAAAEKVHFRLRSLIISPQNVNNKKTKNIAPPQSPPQSRSPDVYLMV